MLVTLPASACTYVATLLHDRYSPLDAAAGPAEKSYPHCLFKNDAMLEAQLPD